MNLPKINNIIMITKSDLESSDSFLAQGGSVCYMMMMIMTVILKIQCGQVIMKTGKNQWIL